MNTTLQFLKNNLIILFSVMTLITYAQQGINYQGVARDVNNNVLVNSEINLKFNINKTTLDGETVYSETHNLTTDANGVFSIVIGEGTVVLNLFEDINWAEDKHFLNVWLNNEEVGATEFMATPYTNAMGKWQAHKNGVAPKGTGGSIFIGDNAGENDDLSNNHNIGFGTDVLKATTVGHNNVAIGQRALKTNRNGYENIAIGIESLHDNISGNFNIGIGPLTLYGNTSGNKNIAIGDLSMHHNSTGNNNIALGEQSLYANTDGFSNIAVGTQSLLSNTTGKHNVALGYSTLANNIFGNDNIALGQNSLQTNASGDNNIALGESSLRSNTTGNKNIALGALSLNKNTTGSSNIAMGGTALYYNTLGKDNIAIGSGGPLFQNTSGNGNLAIGYRGLQANTTGSNNIALGQDALFYNTTGNYNIANGFEALKNNTTGLYNIATGYRALHSNLYGERNVAIGKDAMFSSQIGAANVGIGFEALYLSEQDQNNIAIGQRALKNNNGGDENVVIGVVAGHDNIEGDKNVFIGSHSGENTLGSKNVFIGAYSGSKELGSNTLHISNEIDYDNFPLIYGEFDNKLVGFNSKVGIGTKTPLVPLHVVNGGDASLANGSGQLLLGSESGANLVLDKNEIQARNNGVSAGLYLQQNGGNVYVGNAIVHASDKRLKRNITNISYGLDEVLKLRPTEYFWKGKIQKYKSLGLIAQEVEEIIKNVVTYNQEQDKYGMSYTELIPILIKAIQEQNKIIEAQSLDNNNLKAKAKSFEERLSALEGLSKINN